MEDLQEYEIREMRLEIEDFIRQYDGTAIGLEIKNSYDNSCGSYESLLSIMERIDNVR